MNIQVSKPKQRSKLRLYLGKEYFITKRKLRWLKNRSLYSYVNIHDQTCQYLHKKHQSLLLRPLKDVDIYLQYNKITNLRLAIYKLNGTIIKPGKVFSIWQQVGRPTKGKGYLLGLSLHNGKIDQDIGCGLC